MHNHYFFRSVRQLAHYNQAKLNLAFIYFRTLITRREVEFLCSHAKRHWYTAATFIRQGTSKHCNYITKNWIRQVVRTPPLA